jgi:hypothetical protein
MTPGVGLLRRSLPTLGASNKLTPYLLTSL